MNRYTRGKWLIHGLKHRRDNQSQNLNAQPYTTQPLPST